MSALITGSPARHVFGSFSYSNEDRDIKALRPLGGEGFPLRNRLVTMTWNHTISPSISMSSASASTAV